MRICIDIDGTICELKNVIGSYENVRCLPGVKKFISERRARGDYIILYTARHMKTCNSNVGQVIKKQGYQLLKWLEEEGVEYDEIHFGKPYADIYIDDNAIKFQGNWNEDFCAEVISEKSSESEFKMNIVITMAGAGSRFKKAGFTLEKPMIPIQGIPMYRYSTNSLPLNLAKKIIFIIQKGLNSDAIKKDIAENYCKFDHQIVEIDHLTRGQAETLYYARDKLEFNIPTLVHNADSAVSLNMEVLKGQLLKSDGALVTFESESPNYSFAKTDEVGKVIEVREKECISTHASTGTYYFKSTVKMIELIKGAIDKNITEKGEFYIAPLYNRLIEDGGYVSIIPAKKYVCYGTPSELEQLDINELKFIPMKR